MGTRKLIKLYIEKLMDKLDNWTNETVQKKTGEPR